MRSRSGYIPLMMASMGMCCELCDEEQEWINYKAVYRSVMRLVMRS